MTDITRERVDIVEILRNAAHDQFVQEFASYLPAELRKAADEIERLRALPAPAQPKEWNGRSIGESAPHAAYCDIAMQDAMVEITDKGERLWSYNDELFDKSLAGNGYTIVRIDDAPDLPAPSAWRGMESAPKDKPIVVFCPGRDGLNDMASLCEWHEDAGFCVDELRWPTLWIAPPGKEQEGDK